MKVLYITNNDDKLGGAKALMEIVLEMKKKNYAEPIVLTPKHNKVNEFCDNHNIENYSTKHYCFMFVKSNNKLEYFIKYIPRFIKYKVCNKIAMRKIKNKIDLKSIECIHTNTSIVDIGAVIARKYKIKHIWHIREFGNEDFNFVSYRRNYIDFMNENSNVLVVISNAVKKVWIEKGLKHEKVELIYDGIDVSDIKTREKKSNSKKMKILFSGAITENKGQKCLIEALSYIDKEILKNIEVDFLGKGTEEYERKLKNIVREKKLEGNINFLGYCSDLRERLQLYDVGVVCSKSEGFGRVTAEYMAAKLCVIASDTGANPELIQNEETGLLYEYNNNRDLTKKIIYIYNNRQKIDEFGEKARKKILSNFTKEINASNLKKLYERIME